MLILGSCCSFNEHQGENQSMNESWRGNCKGRASATCFWVKTIAGRAESENVAIGETARTLPAANDRLVIANQGPTPGYPIREIQRLTHSVSSSPYYHNSSLRRPYSRTGHINRYVPPALPTIAPRLPPAPTTPDGNEVFFKIKRTTKLNKLKNAYADRVGKQMNAIRCVASQALVDVRSNQGADTATATDSSTRDARFWTTIRPSRSSSRMVSAPFPTLLRVTTC